MLSYMYRCPYHHTVDNDDLNNAGGTQNPVVDVPQSSVHQRSVDPSHSLFSIVKVDSDSINSIIVFSVISVENHGSSWYWNYSHQMRFLPQQGGQEPETCSYQKLEF